MRLYWVLMWDDYYPDARLENVKGTFETKEEAKEFIRIYKDKVNDDYCDEYIHTFDHYEIFNVQDMVL